MKPGRDANPDWEKFGQWVSLNQKYASGKASKIKLARYPNLSSVLKRNGSLFLGAFFWGGCILLLFMLVGAISLTHFSDMVERMELSLLDFRLKARSETLSPSDRIIVAAMDRYSQDEARNHPEWGLYSRVLPRRQLARIVDFFAERGARAIVLDLSFESPQTPEDDAALAAAIRRAGNVYIAGSMELPLSEYEARQQSRSSQAALLDWSLAFNNYRILPFLHEKLQQARWLPDGCATGYASSGLDGLYRLSSTLSIPDGFWRQVWRSQCMPSNPSPVFLTEKPLYPLKRFYQRQCLEQMYEQVFSRNPGYRALLSARAISLETPLAQEIPSYCLTGNVLEPVLKGSRGLGITAVDYDRDAIIREIPLFYRGYAGQVYSYLGLRPVLDFFPEKPRFLKRQMQWGSRLIPLTSNGQVLLNWRHSQHLSKVTNNADRSSPLSRVSFNEQGDRALNYGHVYRLISAIDILKYSFSHQSQSSSQNALMSPLYTPSLYARYAQPQSGFLSFKDKIVVYGDAIEDVHRTPIGNRIFGVEIVATALDMFWHDHQFIRKATNWQSSLLILLLSALIFYFQIAAPRLLIGFLGGTAVVIAYWLYNLLAFVQFGYWVPLVIPSLLLVLALMSGLLYRYTVQDREKRQLTRVFARYVSPQVMREIIAHPEACLQSLAGVEKDLTVLFADLKGFTERFNHEDPQRMIEQLNEYFTAMTSVILKHQGTYDKYIGDAVMAFFGAPIDFSDHALKACAAALEMRKTLQQLNEKWMRLGIPPLEMGIGLSSGPMIVGNFGSADLQNFTVMGNAVNLGSRLESLTRKVNVPIVISRNTAEQVRNKFNVQDLGFHEIRGFQAPIQAYCLSEANFSE